MNYSEIIRALEQATPFDLYRLHAAIGNMLDDPQRMAVVKKNLRIGDWVEVFEPEVNHTIRVRVLKVRRTRVLAEREDNGKQWLYPFYMLNLQGVDTAINNPDRRTGLSRNEVSIGDHVGFRTRDGRELYGPIIKLNPKTVKIQVGKTTWRVDYSLLFKVLEPGQAEFLPGRRD